MCTLEVLSHCHMSALDQDSGSGEVKDLFQDLGERRLVNLNELLKLVQVIAEQSESLIKSKIC